MNSISSMFAGLMSNAEGWAIDDDDNLGQNPMFHVVRSTGDTVVGNKLGIGSDIPRNNLDLLFDTSGGDRYLSFSRSTWTKITEKR